MINQFICFLHIAHSYKVYFINNIKSVFYEDNFTFTMYRLAQLKLEALYSNHVIVSTRTGVLP